MHDPTAEGRRGFDQAENDLQFAEHALRGQFFHQVCFVAQQCAEKALKAVHYAAGARSVVGHSAVALLDPLVARHGELGTLRDVVAELDLFYIPTRYPDALVGGIPHRVFTRAQAERALAAANAVLAAVRPHL